MSTISIMPLGTHMRINRRVIVPYSQFLSASEKLKDAHRILNESLILEEGDLIRVDGFKAFATAKSYPDVKLTVVPSEGKSAAIYISLENLDGISWEPVKIEEKEKKRKETPSRRYDVSISDNQINTSTIWHRAFGNSYNEKSGTQIINPLELEPNERKKGFAVVDFCKMGDALMTDIDQRRYSYSIHSKVTHRFEPDMIDGLLAMRRSEVKAELVIVTYGSNPERGEIICELELGVTDLVKEIKSWMKKQLKDEQ
jgi:hypothetical protein